MCLTRGEMNDNANVCVVLLAPPDLEELFFACGGCGKFERLECLVVKEN